MTSRYYVANVSGAASRWANIVDATQPVPGRRALPHQLLHWRVSLDGSMRLIQAETNDAEHAYLVSLAWVTYLGAHDDVTAQADTAVHTYIAANAAAWEPVRGG